MIAMLLVWCHLLTGYEPRLVCDNLHKVAPRPPLPVIQVHDEEVSSKGCEFEPPSVHTLYTCRSVAGRLQVRESVRYITHDSYAISVVPPFNNTYTILCHLVKLLNCVVYEHILIKRVTEEVKRMLTVVNVNKVFT